MVKLYLGNRRSFCWQECSGFSRRGRPSVRGTLLLLLASLGVSLMFCSHAQAQSCYAWQGEGQNGIVNGSLDAAAQADVSSYATSVCVSYTYLGPYAGTPQWPSALSDTGQYQYQ